MMSEPRLTLLHISLSFSENIILTENLNYTFSFHRKYSYIRLWAKCAANARAHKMRIFHLLFLRDYRVMQ